MPDFVIESQFSGVVAGVDEVGRGPLAGPVVAAAVIFLKQDLDFIELVNDSKKLTKAKRNSLFTKLTNNAHILYDVAIISNLIIDQVNIFNATKQAMLAAVKKLSTKAKIFHVLVDGNHKMLSNNFPETPVIKGDLKSNSIAAASIIAKVIRDNIMLELGQIHPHYNWKNNSGYPTKAHLAAITQHGITQHHRKSFAPIKFMC